MIGGGGKRVLDLRRRARPTSSASRTFRSSSATTAGLDPQEEAERRIGYVRNGADERFANLEVESSPYFTNITDDPDSALERIAAATGIRSDVLRHHPNVLIGSVETVVDVLESRRESTGVNYVTVQQDRTEEFAPVVAALAGT